MKVAFHILTMLALFYFVLGCLERPKEYKKLQDYSKFPKKADDENKSGEDSVSIGDTIFYQPFEDCKEMDSWVGMIQADSKISDKSLYGFKSCQTDKISFDLIFKLKDTTNVENISLFFSNGSNNNYKYFDIYIFRIPMKNKEYAEEHDPHGDPNIYPAEVKAYKQLSKDKWLLVSIANIKSLKEYGQFQLNVLKK